MFTAIAAQNWGMFVVRGILALVFGVLAFAAPAPTLAALVFVFAFYAVVDGSSRYHRSGGAAARHAGSSWSPG
jgi:uncharacterized membrane protein HdeD (DUF308 family)